MEGAMFKFLRALKGQTKKRSQPRKHPLYVPHLDCLEDRLTPSVSVLTTGTLVNTAGALDTTQSNDTSTQSDLSISMRENVGGVFSSGTNDTGGGAQSPGNTIIYTIVVSNSGPDTAANQTVTDALTAVAGFSSDTWMATASVGSSVTTSSGTGDINDTVTILSGGSVTFVVTAGVSPSASGTLVNTAAVTAPPGDNTPNNNTSTDTVSLLTLLPGASADLSKVGDLEVAGSPIVNTSPVTIYLQNIHDSFLGNLLHAPVSPVVSISGRINGAPVTLQAGLALPAGEVLDVIVTRTVQATDPNPTVGTRTYIFSANADGTGATVQGVSRWNVSIFQPSVTIGLTVDKPSAAVGDKVTYTATIANTSSRNSPNLIAKFQTGKLTSGSAAVTGLSSTSHMFVGEFVFGAGIPANARISSINSASRVTLNKLATSTGARNISFGFGPAIVNGVQKHFVAPPPGFVLPAALTDPAGLAPGEVVQFSYTHVVTASDPKPLNNTLDMFFFVGNSKSHPAPWPDRIHGPSIGVTTRPWTLKNWF